MVDTTWTNGGGDGKASTAANWSNGIDVGYNVLFDATSTANCTFDYDGQLGTFTIGSGYSGTITQSSDMHITGYSQAGGTFTGVTTKWVYCSGNWSESGTMTILKTRLIMTGQNKTLYQSSGTFLYTRFMGSTVLSHSVGTSVITNCLIIDSGVVVTVSNGKIFQYLSYNSGNYLNNGLINSIGNGYFEIRTKTENPIFSFGSISCPVYLIGQSNMLGNNIITINSSDNDLASLIVYSNHVTYTSTLNLNGHSLTATTITVGTRGILSNSASTDSVVSCANFDSSAGTFTEANTQVILNGNGTLKTAAGHKFDELVQRDNVITTLGSNITVTNEFDTAGSFVQGAYSITHENPEKRLIAPMVNPIIRNPKRSPFLNNRFTKNIEIEVV